MKIIPGNAQHIGKRAAQQDEFWFSDIHDQDFIAHGGVLAIVADGMGGMEKSGESSRLAARTFGLAYLTKAPAEPIPDALQNALNQANLAVCELSRSVDAFNNVGTTLTAAVIAGSSLHWVSVGDSRLYLLRKGRLTQLTRDHNYGGVLQSQVANGSLSVAEALADPDRNALTSYLGLPELAEVDRSISPVTVEPGDWVVLCSDGLHGSLSEREMEEELHGIPQEAADGLIQRVLEKDKPHQDNVTVAILSLPNGRIKPASRRKGVAFWQRGYFWAGLFGISLLLAVAWMGWRHWGSEEKPTAPPKQEAAATPATAQENPKIEILMEIAAEYIKKERFIEPPRENALDAYREILKHEPNYEPAKEALKKLSETLDKRAEAARQAGDKKTAKKLWQAAETALIASDPESKLHDYRQKLEAIRAKKGT